MLLLPELGLLPASDERFVRTCAVIGKELKRNGFIMRYAAEDDFGLPETAFLVCQFWYIDALAALGRKEEAREMFADLLARRNAFGLLSEDIHPIDRRAVGQPAPDLLHGRHRQYGPHSLAQLAGSLGAGRELELPTSGPSRFVPTMLVGARQRGRNLEPRPGVTHLRKRTADAIAHR